MRIRATWPAGSVAAGAGGAGVRTGCRRWPTGPALPGAHNAQNAAAATAMARFFGVPDERDRRRAAQLSRAAASAAAGRHVDGVTFVNDSKATNADAAERALVCYDRVIWIAGGMAKEGGIEPLAPLFPRIARAMLIGRDAPVFAETLTRHGVPFDIVGTLEAAVPAAFAAAKSLRCAGRAAVAGLRQLGPVHRI